MNRHLRYCLILLIVLFTQCEEPIDLKLKDTDTEYLVVDGFITTEAKAHTITISRSSPFRNNEITPFVKENLQSIEIVDDLGSVTPLFLVTQGVYETPDNFAAVEGRTYQLRFTRENGENYETQPQTIPPKGRIDDLYFEYEVRQIYNSEADQFVDRGGIQFKANYTFPSEDSFMAFDWEGTYVFRDPAKPCYVRDENSGIAPLVSNTRFNNLAFEEQDLFFLNHDFRFREKYSLNLLLYTMDQSAFNFLSDVQAQLNSSGSIFDPAPQQLNGNIYNVRDESEVVLGYFGAFNITSKRIFIIPAQIPAPEPYNVCSRGGPGMPPSYCFDCVLLLGASENIPSFWE